MHISNIRSVNDSSLGGGTKQSLAFIQFGRKYPLLCGSGTETGPHRSSRNPARQGKQGETAAAAAAGDGCEQGENPPLWIGCTVLSCAVNRIFAEPGGAGIGCSQGEQGGCRLPARRPPAGPIPRGRCDAYDAPGPGAGLLREHRLYLQLCCGKFRNAWIYPEKYSSSSTSMSHWDATRVRRDPWWHDHKKPGWDQTLQQPEDHTHTPAAQHNWKAYIQHFNVGFRVSILTWTSMVCWDYCLCISSSPLVLLFLVFSWLKECRICNLWSSSIY
jgi:hypothetical protein